jgi:hypothetical protein
MPKGCDRLALNRGVVCGLSGFMSPCSVHGAKDAVEAHVYPRSPPDCVFPWYRVQSKLQQNVTASVDT